LPVVVHDLTPHVRAALVAGTVDACIAQDLGHVVRSALRVLRARIEGTAIDPAQEAIRIEVLVRENLADTPAA
jgi:LacI family transcriptional regulator